MQSVSDNEETSSEALSGNEDDDRRAFLRKCGQYAAITPPAVTFLLSTTLSSKAIAASSGRPAHAGKGWGMGGSKGRGRGPGSSKGGGPGRGGKGH